MRPPPDGVIDGRADGGLHMDVKQAQLHPPTLPHPKTHSQQKVRTFTHTFIPRWSGVGPADSACPLAARSSQ